MADIPGGFDVAMTLEEIVKEGLKQDVRARARIAHALLESLETLSPEEAERLWAEEAQKRDDEAEAGRATERPFDEVMRDVRKRLG